MKTSSRKEGYCSRIPDMLVHVELKREAVALTIPVAPICAMIAAIGAWMDVLLAVHVAVVVVVVINMTNNAIAYDHEINIVQ
jgi:hypothetical protein